MNQVNPQRFRSLAASFVLAAASLLTVGCASLSPDGGATDVSALAEPAVRAMGVPAGQAASDRQVSVQDVVSKLLAGPTLSMDDAVRIALVNNPGLQASMAELRISDAERVQAASWPNLHISFQRAVEGDKVMLERGLGFNVLGLVTLPWRSALADHQHQAAKLQAAQAVVLLASETRKAWIRAVAAQQAVNYGEQAIGAAEAAGELARRMARVGNWSKLAQAKEQSMLAEALAAHARAKHNALAERERLVRWMGLWGQQTLFNLPERLPDLPTSVMDAKDLEARTIAQRLDVRAASQRAEAIARSLGWVEASGWINALDLKVFNETTHDQATGGSENKSGWEVELSVPIFDWGRSTNARAKANYDQAVAQLRATAITARSEARESWHSYRTAYDTAKHYRDEIVPLRKFISDEMLLRYNGMLLGVFDLLADTRGTVQTVVSAIEAQRDFWLVDTDLRTVLSGTSPGTISSSRAPAGALAAQKDH
jgi:outer membrane protein, multidrug efflux system